MPDFTLEAERKRLTPNYAIEYLQQWLNERGLIYVEIALPENMPWNPLPFPLLCILLGETSAGIKHALVGRAEGSQHFEVWNPWPGAELAGLGAVGFIVPRDPATYMKLGIGLARIERLSSGYESDEPQSAAHIKLNSIHATAQEMLGTGAPGATLTQGLNGHKA